jgi:peptide-methionine (S)-S-oxide reductase
LVNKNYYFNVKPTKNYASSLPRDSKAIEKNLLPERGDHMNFNEKNSEKAEFHKSPDKNGGRLETAAFGAGCFWGVQHILSNIPGVADTTAGYMGGTLEDPDYRLVCSGNSGHAETVQISFDPAVISYDELLDYFWRLHDPTTLNRQGPDIGTQYRSVIFYYSESQKREALDSIEKFNQSGIFKNRAVTEIVPAGRFYKAEEYHQNYFQKNSGMACHLLRNI